ncbi:hypothetical protein EDB85DRAFT_2141090 [Lactarius pseudohatsudake]|nr:hypothetical protein EDB85DRAFT_2141090 [Lactarius pseudohatsudake]
MQHAKREDEMHTIWESLLSDLQRSVDDLQTSPSISDRIYVDFSEKIIGELQQVLRAHQETFDVHLQQSMGHSLALSDHSRTLMDLSTEFERSLSSRLDSVYELLDSQISTAFTASDKIWQRVSLIEGGLLSAMNASQPFLFCLFASTHASPVQSLTELSLSTSHLSDALNSSAVEVKFMNIAQADAVRATARLAGTLQLMNETVMRALTDINTTAIKVNNTLGARSFPLYADILSSASAIVAYCEDDHRSLLIHLRCPRLTVSSEPDVSSTPGLPVSVVPFLQVVLSRCDGWILAASPPVSVEIVSGFSYTGQALSAPR